MARVSFPSPHPFPQIFYGPQVDRLKDKGIGHWLDFQKRHGFHGILIPCAGLPLDHTGIRALVERNPQWTLVRLFGDKQSGQVPAGGLLGEEAMSYYRTLYRLLGDFGPEKWGVTVGFDPFEWTTRDELDEWVDLMADLLDPFGDERMIGARARTRDDEPPNSKPNPGTYAPWALRVIEKDRFRSMLQDAVDDSGSTPTMAEDGLRDRPGGRSKDWTEKQMIEQGFQVALDEGVGATWARWSDESGDDGSIDWRDPDAVREILSPGNGNGNGNGEPAECCVLACESGSKIRGIRGRVEAILFDLREVEDELLAACDASPDPDPDPGHDPEDPDLADAISVGVSKGWRPQKFTVVADPITSISRFDRDPFVIKWNDPTGPDFPIGGDFGPSDDGRFARVYIVARNRRDGKLYTWGIEWTRVENERTRTSIGAWDGKSMIETLIAKAKGNGLPSDFEFEPDGQVGIYLGNPETRKRTPVRWKEFRG